MLSSLLLSNYKVLVEEHLVPVIQLGIEIERTRCHQILMRQSHLPECRLSKTLSNSKIRHEVVEMLRGMKLLLTQLDHGRYQWSLATIC
jgi:hypothetical protein